MLVLHNDLWASLTAQNQKCREQKAALEAKDREIAKLTEQLRRQEGKLLYA